MATILESIKARENALLSPSNAAQYLFDQNKSTFTSTEEAKTALDAMEKFAYSKSYAKAFADKWDSLNGGKTTISLSGSGFSEYSAIQKKIKSLGALIRENASLSSDQKTELVQSSNYDPQSAKQVEDAFESAKTFVMNLAESGAKVSDPVAAEKQVRYVKADGVNVRDPKSYKKILGTLNKGSVVLLMSKIANPDFPKSPQFVEIMIDDFGGKKNFVAAIALDYLSESKISKSKPSSKKPVSITNKVDTGYKSPQTSILENKVVLAGAALVVGYIAYNALIKDSAE